MAFTDYETEQLRKALLKETRRCAVTLGMKKTSVDQLTKAVEQNTVDALIKQWDADAAQFATMVKPYLLYR